METGSQKEIDDFFNAIAVIEKKIGENKGIYGFFAYNAYFSLFDLLSNYAFPKDKLRSRYVKLISKYSDWLYKRYVSIVQLNCLINNDSKFSDSILRTIFQNKINRKGLFSIRNGMIDEPKKYDFKIEELMSGLNKEQMNEFIKKKHTILKARYDSLFYYMRCLCVHGLQFPTPNAPNFKEDGYTPSYYVMLDVNKIVGQIVNPEYVLWFPPNLIKNLFNECFENIRQEAIISPQQIFRPYYVYWIDQFK